MSKGKGKEEPLQALTQPPLLNPASGSANPSASFSALWNYILPALDHILKSPTNDLNKAPSIDVGFYAGVHTAVYNYFNFQSEMANASRDKDAVMSNGCDLYDQLDMYLGDACRDIFLAAPHDDTTLIHYLIPAFTRYSTGGNSIHRLLQYVNRHYVKRAVDDDKGWLRLNDVLESVAKSISITSEDTRQKISKRLKERKTNELKAWGYVEGGPPELLARAEASAEAASSPDRVIPINTLVCRRFRIDIIEPLLSVPKSKKAKAKAKAKAQAAAEAAAANGDPPPPPPPKGRLARAVKYLLERDDIEEAERRNLVIGLSDCLSKVGIRSDHVLRKKLDKYIATGSDD